MNTYSKEELQLFANALTGAVNLMCFIVGMFGVWATTKSVTALIFTLVAAIHTKVTLK